MKDGVTVGIGTGEQDRVGVAEIGIFKLIPNMRMPFVLSGTAFLIRIWRFRLKREKRVVTA